MTAATITKEIEAAIEELRATFPEAAVTFEPDGSGGAWVAISSVPMGLAHVPPTSWMAFNLTFAYPEADVYPLFVTPELHRADEAPLGDGFQAVSFGPDVRPGVQLSRRSSRLNPAVDTAATKVLKVLEWLAAR